MTMMLWSEHQQPACREHLEEEEFLQWKPRMTLREEMDSRTRKIRDKKEETIELLNRKTKIQLDKIPHKLIKEAR